MLSDLLELVSKLNTDAKPSRRPEQSELQAERFSLAELCAIGFNIDDETIESIRESSSLSYGKKLMIH